MTSLSSSAGALANTLYVRLFGKLTNSSGTLTNPFQYTGRELDSETGLYYYRARYYDPATGRFLSEDPVGFFASRDFYSYVGNTPTGFNDPFGLAQCVYSISQHTMTCASDVNPQVGPRWELAWHQDSISVTLARAKIIRNARIIRIMAESSRVDTK